MITPIVCPSVSGESFDNLRDPARLIFVMKPLGLTNCFGSPPCSAAAGVFRKTSPNRNTLDVERTGLAKSATELRTDGRYRERRHTGGSKAIPVGEWTRLGTPRGYRPQRSSFRWKYILNSNNKLANAILSPFRQIYDYMREICASFTIPLLRTVTSTHASLNFRLRWRVARNMVARDFIPSFWRTSRRRSASPHRQLGTLASTFRHRVLTPTRSRSLPWEFEIWSLELNQIMQWERTLCCSERAVMGEFDTRDSFSRTA